jgi:YNFM family putative membrane transporter
MIPAGPNVLSVSVETPSEALPWTGHERGSVEYRRLLAALFCAGIATFAQLYSPQAVLPLIARGLHTSAAASALMVSASTIGLAIGVIGWSMLADRIGRVKAMSLSVGIATVLGLVVPFVPTFQALLTGRLVEGLALGGVPAIAVAYLTEEIEPGHAARAAGTYVAGTTIGGLLGRLVSAPVAEALGWRLGMFAVALLCSAAAFGFTRLAPAPRGFRPGAGGDAAEGSLGHRLLVNLRSGRQRALYLQGFLLMGGFVAMYNFLGFRLSAPPFSLPQTVVSLVFVAYLAGTWASARAGAGATRYGRGPVLLGSIAVMVVGVGITLSSNVIVVLIGLLVATAGFFGAHAIASGWTGQLATVGKAQASSLYNLAYYAGSSVVGWLGGLAFDAAGWTAVALTILVLELVAGAIAALVLRH